MLIVISQKRQRRVLILNLGAKYNPVPLQHLFETARVVDDVNEFGRSDSHCGACSSSPTPFAEHTLNGSGAYGGFWGRKRFAVGEGETLFEFHRESNQIRGMGWA